jgi:hypothetical protein
MIGMVLLEYGLSQSHILCLGLFLSLTSKFLPSLMLILLTTMQIAQIFLGLVIAFNRLFFQPIQLKLLFV